MILVIAGDWRRPISRKVQIFASTFTQTEIRIFVARIEYDTRRKTAGKQQVAFTLHPYEHDSHETHFGDEAVRKLNGCAPCLKPCWWRLTVMAKRWQWR